MNTAIPMPDPSDDEVERAVAQVEKYVAGQTSIAEGAVTKRVRELRAEVDEAHALLALQADNTPLLVDTDRVRRTRRTSLYSDVRTWLSAARGDMTTTQRWPASMAELRQR